MYLFLLKAGILGILTPKVLCGKEQYEGDQVLEIIPQNEVQVGYLKDICLSPLLDLWKPSQPQDINVGTRVHVRIPSTALQSVKVELLHCSLSFQILIENVRDVVLRTQESNVRLKRSLASYDYTKYHSMEEIYLWINQMAENNRDLVTQHSLGETYESRPMQYLKISQKSSKPKKIVWMDCGIHAREWIAPAFCQWFVKQIVQNHQSDPKIKNILDNVDIYVLPVLNIDGYIYTWTHERLWRKSRSSHERGTCFGVDLNRNFDVNWCVLGSSMNCSSNSFCGSSPASEPETKAVVSFIEKWKTDIICYLSIHSYGQLILTAYGYTTELPRNYNETVKVAHMAASELKKIHGTDYRVGSFSKVLYYASGTSQDWVHNLGIDYSYTLELRDNGTSHFILPEDQIRPTCEETMAAVMTIIDHVNNKYFPNTAPVASVSFWLFTCAALQIVLPDLQ